MEFDDLVELLRALEKAKVRYAVVGAVALNFHGLARATADIDLFVSPDEQNVDRLKAALQSIFSDPEIEKIRYADLAGAYPAIQYVPPSGVYHIDILSRLGAAFTFEDIETQEMEFEGIRVRVATPGMLYRMKKDTVRMQDRADAERLRKRFNLEPEDGCR